MYPTDPQCTRASSKHGAPPAWRPDCFTNHVKNASKIARAAGKPFYMTEYNVGCCPDTQSDDAGAAAFVFQEIAELDGHADILSWWTFTDVFGVCTLVVCLFLLLSFSPGGCLCRRGGWAANNRVHQSVWPEDTPRHSEACLACVSACARACWRTEAATDCYGAPPTAAASCASSSSSTTGFLRRGE